MSKSLVQLALKALIRAPEKPVLFALCWHCPNDIGTNVWPSVNLICLETGYARSTVQESMRILEDNGLIKPVTTKDGGRKITTEYEIDIERLRGFQAHCGKTVEYPWKPGKYSPLRGFRNSPPHDETARHTGENSPPHGHKKYEHEEQEQTAIEVEGVPAPSIVAIPLPIQTSPERLPPRNEQDKDLIRIKTLIDDQRRRLSEGAAKGGWQ